MEYNDLVAEASAVQIAPADLEETVKIHGGRLKGVNLDRSSAVDTVSRLQRRRTEHQRRLSVGPLV